MDAASKSTAVEASTAAAAAAVGGRGRDGDSNLDSNDDDEFLGFDVESGAGQGGAADDSWIRLPEAETLLLTRGQRVHLAIGEVY